MPMFFVVSGYFFRSGKLRKTLMKLFTAYATLGLFHYAIWLGINRGDTSIIAPLRALVWNCTSLVNILTQKHRRSHREHRCQ